MPYKVFFVEDEVLTREGIRDNVNWEAYGFEFCGEAGDGEMALPLIKMAKPDVLITDIKMPFMDGLQLCKIVRERLPWIKVIILSGHDEFEYAQEAIKLGVTEYLLKPVTEQDLHQVLQRMAVQLAEEKQEQETLQKLQTEIEENRATLRERFLLKLMMGGVSSGDAMEQGQSLGLDLIARCYRVAILKTELGDRSEQFDYDEYRQVQNFVANLVVNNPDIFLVKKDWGELVLVMKGNAPEFIEDEFQVLLEHVRQVVNTTRYHLVVGAGAPVRRIGELYQSFVEALVRLQGNTTEDRNRSNPAVAREELLKLDKTAVERFLRLGSKDGLEEFFNSYLDPIGATALQSDLIKNYIFCDFVLAAAKLVNELGGDLNQVIPELNSLESILGEMKTSAQLKEQAQQILISALAYRDSQTGSQYTGLIHQAKEYMERHYMDPDFTLNQVAELVNLSPSHFSVVFSRQVGETFKEYLTDIRIKKAKELLRTTALRSTDIAFLVGYNDPHYFSTVFKKNTGHSPSLFRLQSQP
jgi:two-component system response regulator YesN